MPNKSKGLGLFTVLAALLIMIALVVIGINFVLSNYHLSYHVRQGIKAFYLADAGIKRAMYKIATTPNPEGSESWTTFVAGETIVLDITSLAPSEPNNYEVSSSCSTGDLSSIKKIRAKIAKTTGIKLLEWEILN